MKIDLFSQVGYNLACGIRGVDVYTEPADTPAEQKVVKWVITARIRGLAGVNPLGHGNMVRQQPGLVDEGAFRRFNFPKPTLDDFLEGTLSLPDHYLAHAQTALEAIAALSPASTHEALLLKTLISDVRFHGRKCDMLIATWEELFGGEDES